MKDFENKTADVILGFVNKKDKSNECLNECQILQSHICTRQGFKKCPKTMILESLVTLTKVNVMPGQDYLIALQAYSNACFVKL